MWFPDRFLLLYPYLSSLISRSVLFPCFSVALTHHNPGRADQPTIQFISLLYFINHSSLLPCPLSHCFMRGWIEGLSHRLDFRHTLCSSNATYRPPREQR